MESTRNVKSINESFSTCVVSLVIFTSNHVKIVLGISSDSEKCCHVTSTAETIYSCRCYFSGIRRGSIPRVAKCFHCFELQIAKSDVFRRGKLNEKYVF